LLAAIKLTKLSGIYVDEEVTVVSYFHLLFDCHHIIFVEGTKTESFLVGPIALAGLNAAAREEVLTIFPECATAEFEPQTARLIPVGKRQKRLVERHRKNHQPCVEMV